MGKRATPFTICLNDHMKDAKSQTSILVCKHFNKQNRTFQEYAEFTLIEQIKKQTTAKETRILLKRRENF